MDFRRSLAISAAFHFTLILLSSYHLILPARRKYIVVPVDLMYYSPPTIPRALVSEEKQKEEEVVIPRRRVTKKITKPKKVESKKQEEKSQSQTHSPVPSRISHAEATSNITADTAKFPYLYYLRKVREAVSRNWGWSSSGDDGGGEGILKTVVYFKILRDGKIISPVIKEKSGDSVFDTLALRAVVAASPFPPLPSGYEEENLGVYFEFSYKE